VKVWDARTGKNLLTLEGLISGVNAVAFSLDGSRIFGVDLTGEILAWDVRSGERSPAAPKVMPATSRYLAWHGYRRACAAGKRVCIERLLSPDEWRHYHLHEGSAEAVRRARRDRAFHADAADRTEKIDPFACVFHLERLLALSPDQRPALLKRRSSVLSATLKSNPDDHHSARSLARQAVANPATVPDAKALLALLARHPHAALDRLYGALLRTGNAREAAVVLRGAIRNRTSDQPPIDELLLALALIQLDRRDEARQFLARAAEWMDHGTAPQRLASLVGARPAGPLAALTALAHVPDVRLNPLDPFTAHELHTLRAELEK
jgi:hypothetical protein